MPQQPRPAVGENIAMLRKSSGLTQAQLAHKAKISSSLLSKIEVGDRAATPPVVAVIAQAMNTTTARLYGTGTTSGSLDLDPVRAAVRCYDLPGDPGGITADTLAGALAEAAALRAATEYDDLAGVLPPLITDATAYAHAVDTPAAWTLLSDAFGCAYTLAHRLGHADLAESITARQEWAATRTWTPIAKAAADWNRAGTFQSAGDYDRGLAVVEDAVTALAAAGVPGLEATAVRGALHLRAVTLASRAEDKGTAQDHLRRAATLTGQLPPGDVLTHNLTFGTGNTLLHRLAALVELGQPDKAVDLAEGFTPGPDLKPTRVAHFHIDTARAHLATDDRDAALRSLKDADDVAPQLARVHPMAREVGRVLVSKWKRSNPDLVDIATSLGLDM
ncbi:helix-turn-helix domain-containing protein [Streptomyces sp. NPDC092296]|uniref:helix-turn-helix domain-containing protein n=1 Tax=Streptomyces sp. NPDC092296 TaxID=3366012 RepID=UPI00381035B9